MPGRAKKKEHPRKAEGSSGSEESVRDSQALLAGIVESAMDAIITVDSEQRVLFFNRAAERMFRCPAADALGRPLDGLIPDRFRDLHAQHIHNFGRTGVTTRAMGGARAVSGLRADGEEFPVEASISQVEAGGRKLYTVILRDITERKRAEDRIREQAALLDEARDAILVRDLEDRIVYWNRGAQALFGWSAEEAVGRNARDLLHRKDPAQFDQAKRTLIEAGQWSGELCLVCKDGLEMIVDGRWTLVRDEQGDPKSVLVIDTDITEKKKMEAQFLRAQRMESIGTLAGGIAHDLNNVLSPILMSLQVLQLKYVDEESRRWLRILEESAARGAGMVSQVLAFARGTEGKPITVQPKHLLKDVIKILGETFSKAIEIKYSLPSELWAVSVDTTQIHQVLMNLCVNARDAMPQGGVLRINAENVTLDETYARMNAEARPGQFVRIRIEDTGMGMPPAVLGRIFEPFFTTKELGKGTGLGLSTALALVKSHNGFMNVYSEEGRGTRFAVYLPAVEIGRKEQADEIAQKLPTGNGELILVVDDEDSIRQITKGTLETFGYKVLLASDGTEAVAIYAQHKGEIRVVLTDMMMPFMDGVATIRALKRLNPEVKIISASGLGDQAKAEEAKSAGVKVFIPKPYTAETLLTMLARILAAE